MPSCSFWPRPSLAQTVWLETLDLGKMTTGYGTPQAGKSIDGHPLTLGGVVYPHGVGTHAASMFAVNLHGAATRFTATAGVDDEQQRGTGSVAFTVLVDGKIAARTPILHAGDKPQPISVDLTGAKTMTLKVRDGGDGISGDHADWAGAEITLADNATAKPKAVAAPADVPDAIAALADSRTITGRTTGTGDPLTLWYDRPAQVWEQALPVGNGRLGGMIFGGVDHERLQLNDITVWSGGPELTADKPDAYKHLPELRAAIRAGDHRKSDELAQQYMTCQSGYEPSYQTLGDLAFDFALPAGAVTDYRALAGYRQGRLRRGVHAERRPLPPGSVFQRARRSHRRAPDVQPQTRRQLYPEPVPCHLGPDDDPGRRYTGHGRQHRHWGQSGQPGLRSAGQSHRARRHGHGLRVTDHGAGRGRGDCLIGGGHDLPARLCQELSRRRPPTPPCKRRWPMRPLSPTPR